MGMTIVITAKNRLTNKVNETVTRVDNLQQAQSLHNTHRALFMDSDVETFSPTGTLFNSVAVSAKTECKVIDMVEVNGVKFNANIGSESKAYWKWFNVSLN